MEIKQTPRVTRPVEEVSGNSKWPWIILVIVIVFLLLAGVLIYFYFIGKPATSDKEAQNTAVEENTEPLVGATSSFIKDTDPEDLTEIVYGRFNDPVSFDEFDIFTGPIDLVSADSTSPTAKESDLFTFDNKSDDESVLGSVSPNGQFISLVNLSESQLFVGELPDGPVEQVETPAGLSIQGPVWLPDSTGFIFSTIDSSFSGSSTELVFYDVESGESESYVREESNDLDKILLPVMATKDELFVIRSADGSEDPGSLGVIEIGASNALDGDFEQLSDLSIAQRGRMAVSPDGKLISWAEGSGAELGSSDNGPFSLELLDRATGQITTLRKSANEGYTSPIFTPDGDSLVYGAASGIWILDLATKERVQIIDIDDQDDVDFGSLAVPVSVRPDSGMLLVATDNGSQTAFSITPLDELSQLVDLDSPNDQENNFYGWTEAI